MKPATYVSCVTPYFTVMFSGEDSGPQQHGRYDYREGRQLYQTDQGGEWRLRTDITKVQRHEPTRAMRDSCR